MEGLIFFNKYGSRMTIIKYENSRNVTVRFDTGFITKTQLGSIRLGQVKDPLFPSVCGIGYTGIGIYKCSKDNVVSKKYSDWRGMLKRCYNEQALIKTPAYRGCYVVEEWFNFQNFADWHSRQKNSDVWALDKDIISIGNKKYCPDNCCFLPVEINSLLTNHGRARGNARQGVYFDGSGYISHVSIDSKIKYLGYFKTEDEAFAAYKKAKEENVKRMAEKYKGIIDDRAYESLMNYSI